MAKPKDPVDKKKVEKPVEAAPKLDKKAEGVDKVKAASKIERKKGEIVESGKDARKKVSDPFEKEMVASQNRKALIEKNISNLPKLAEVLKGAEKVDLEQLSVKALTKLEKAYPGILLYAFTDVIGSKEKIDFANWELYKKPIAGLKLKVDFHGNKGAYDRIGAGDLMPASVRRITIRPLDYRGKNTKDMQRTSTRRLGLKGRDENGSGNAVGGSGNGFFDENGYMPIFTGDEIIIGGATDSKKGIDMAYEKRFSTVGKDGKTDLNYDAYEKSAEAAEDKKYLDKLVANDAVLKNRKPGRGFSEDYDDADIKTIIERCDGNPKVKELVEIAVGFAAALKRYPKGFKGPYEYRGRIIKHAADCGKWVAQIRRMAGFNSPVGRVVFNGQSRYSGRNYEGHQAKPEQLKSMLRPGDWIWYYNGNQYWRGLHSAMFLGWKDEGKMIADCASGDGNLKWRIHKEGTNLNPNDPKGRPVVWINKPFA
jgi:hypothetical protein